MPSIIQFTAKYCHLEVFNTMITPKDNEHFEIHQEASEVHGWTKDGLLSLPIDQRPSIKKAWFDFLSWAKEIRMLKKKPIVLCSYNGFGFDFRVLIQNLSLYDVTI